MTKKIRLWKLGSLEHKVAPTVQAAERLADILRSEDSGYLDIVWGPDIDVIVVDGNIHDEIETHSTEMSIAILESQGYCVIPPTK